MLLTRGGLVGLVAATLYVWVAPTHIVDGDNAEFATLGAIGGTAHPTGYPLYLLWLRAMQWLPGQTPAHTAALATALLGAASIVALHAACRAWGARTLGATAAVAVFAGAPVVMRISSEAEVFALNNLIVAIVLWLSAAGGPLRGTWRVAVLGLVAGLGLSNHMTCVLIAPVGLLGVVRGMREIASPRARVIAGAAGIGALVLGLLPFVYLLVTPDTPMSWGTVRSLGDLYAMVTRHDFGGAGAFAATGQKVSAGAQLWALAQMLGRTWLVVGAIGGLAVLGWRIARPLPEAESRGGWIALAVSFVIAGPILVARFNLDPAGELNLYVCERFYVLPALMLAIPVAVGLSRLGDRRWASAGVAVAGLLGAASLSLPALQRLHSPALERYDENQLSSLPANAVVFLGRDEEVLGTGYLQWARGVRPDVTVVAHQLARLPWYAKRIAARGIVAPRGEGDPILRVIDGLLAAGRPVFVEKTRTEVIASHPCYPFGTVVKVLPVGAQLPPIDQVVIENEHIFSKFRFDYERPRRGEDSPFFVHQRYAATWFILSKALDDAGDHENAQRLRGVAEGLLPGT